MVETKQQIPELRKITDKEAEFSALYARMDADRDLYNLKKFTLKDVNGMDIPDVENITLNKPQVFADRVLAGLGSATMQTVVEGEGLKDKETTYIENLLDACYALIDEDLAAKGKGILALRQFVEGQICMRGRVAARLWMSGEREDFKLEVLPIDTRYLVYDIGKYPWYSIISTRSKQQILDEYGINTDKSDIEVRDYWDNEVERVFIADYMAKEQEHGLGSPPIVLEAVATMGSAFHDSDALQYTGESILAPIRGLVNELNKMATVLNTLNMMTFMGGLQYESAEGKGAAKPDRPPYGKRIVVPVEKGAGYKPMPINDIRNASRLLYSMLEGAIQQGSLPAVDYGSLNFPLSAVAISRLTESKDQLYVPRLQTEAKFYQRLSKKIIGQVIARGIRISMRINGVRQDFSASELDKEFDISYKFYSSSPEQNIANYSIAAAARPFISDDTIARDIIKLRDPDEEQNKRLAEMADRAIPELALYKMGLAKIAEGKDIEARIIATKIGVTLKQLISGQVTPPAPPEKTQPNATIPLLGKGGLGPTGGKTSAKQAEEMGTQGMAEEET